MSARCTTVPTCRAVSPAQSNSTARALGSAGGSGRSAPLSTAAGGGGIARRVKNVYHLVLAAADDIVAGYTEVSSSKVLSARPNGFG